MLRQLLTADSSCDVGGDDSSGCRRTNGMADSNHNTDMVGSMNSDTDCSIHTGNIHNSPDIRSLFRPIYQRQNVAPERKPLPLSPIQLREVFSLFFLLMIKQESEGKVFRFILVQKSLDMP